MNKSHEYDKILTRLTIILQRLYDGETLSVTELAGEFNVSTKTIQRDFNERLIRFPIEKSGRRWRMRPGFRIEKTQDIDNLLTLQILETIAGGIGSRFAERSRALLSKLKNGTAAPIRSYVSIEDVSDLADLFTLLEEAIDSRRRVGFRYHGKKRRVDPYRIVNFDGYWYLLARESGGIVKKFYIREIESPRPLEEPFTPDARLKERLDGALNAWFDPNAEPFELHLLAREPIVKYLYRRPLSPSQRIVARHTNGDVEIRFKVTSVEEALPVLKAWLPDLAVLAPESVKEAYEALLKSSLRLQTGHDAF
ncbi:helix-turn-helix transcriptional regulator [Hydrogenimonas sp.]